MSGQGTRAEPRDGGRVFLGPCMEACGEHEQLTGEERRVLRAWIDRSFEKASRAYPRTSYGLKHSFEAEPEGFYVTNGQFKWAMVEAGYDPVEERDLNWRFRCKPSRELRMGV